MKNILLSFLIFFTTSILFSQENTRIFNGFYAGMSKVEVEEELKNNKKKYKKIDIGIDWIWKIDNKSFYYRDNKLVGLHFFKKGGAEVENILFKIIFGLEMSKKFFKKLGYIEFYENIYWNSPTLYNNPYGLILFSNDNKRVVHIYPKRGEIGFEVGLAMYEQIFFMKSWEIVKDKLDIRNNQTGF